MRAVNVGGHQRFSVAQLARDLADYDVVNIGAAGTFAVRANVSAAAFRKALEAALPFDVETMICPAAEIRRLAATGVFAAPVADGVQRMLTILASRPKVSLPAGLRHPDGERWESQVVASSGRYICVLTRRLGTQPVNSNLLLEKRLGTSGTTRNWNTIVRVLKALETQ